jgi:hypothetical protein
MRGAWRFGMNPHEAPTAIYRVAPRRRPLAALTYTCAGALLALVAVQARSSIAPHSAPRVLAPVAPAHEEPAPSLSATLPLPVPPADLAAVPSPTAAPLEPPAVAPPTEIRPEAFEVALRQRRYVSALGAIPEDSPQREAWRAEVHDAWLAQLQRSRGSLHARHAAELARFRAEWPEDRAVADLQQQRRERVRAEVGRLQVSLTKAGLEARLVAEPRGERYAIEARWTGSSREMALAIKADPVRGVVGAVAELVARVGYITADTALETTDASVIFSEKLGGIRFPTACAREFVRVAAQDPSAGLAKLDCVRRTASAAAR